MYAIIKTGGKQFKVTEGQTIYIEKLEAEAGDTVTFTEVLAVGSNVGRPFVAGASVEGTVDKQGLQKKITVFKYKPKKDSAKKQGHRQPYTKVTITKINA